jgi:hypothetical protein
LKRPRCAGSRIPDDGSGLGVRRSSSRHVALENHGEIIVLDIWVSQEDFAVFGAIGVDVAEPVVGRVPNVIDG